MLSVRHLAWVILCITLSPAHAEIYKWVDRHGRIHFSDTTAGIPPEYHDRIEATGALPSSLVPPPTPHSEPTAHLASAPRPAPTSYTVPLRRDGNAMLVDALLGGTVPTRLLLDTGAEFTVISSVAARRLALNTLHAVVIPLRSASGIFLAPLLKVPSIAVGEAAVQDVEVIVHDATPGLDGLLGMSFLDHFLVTINPSDERLMLTPSAARLDRELYGGHPREWWSRKFRFYRSQIESVRSYLSGRYAPELERTLRYFRTELEALDRLASQVGVPQDWRH